jgi:alpha-tubulin suppressor-like RCC1 family protein
MGECKDQLGVGSLGNTVQSEPIVVESLIEEKIVQLCAGFVHSVALTGKLFTIEKFKLVASGKVYTFGSKEDGKLGYDTNDSSKPNLVKGLEKMFITQVSAGYYAK